MKAINYNLKDVGAAILRACKVTLREDTPELSILTEQERDIMLYLIDIGEGRAME